jgi:SAM-dependent methyltransferase
MEATLEKRLEKAASENLRQLPAFWQEFRQNQLARVVEEVSWVFKEGGTIIDLGGSNGFHASVCSSMGMKAYCVDNFKIRGMGTMDDYYFDDDLEAEKVSKELGVNFVHTDLLTWEPEFEDESIDAVMTFDNIEHLHHSPRGTYQKLFKKVKKGGYFLIGAPNAANILKRLRILLGKNVFSPLDDWYFHPKFIGHVREPIIEDYYQIANDLGLEVVKIIGRNWLGYQKYGDQGVKAKLIAGADQLLRPFPSLCSDIYILAKKPG